MSEPEPFPSLPATSEDNVPQSNLARHHTANNLGDAFTAADVAALLSVNTGSGSGNGASALLSDDIGYDGHAALAIDAAAIGALEHTIDLLTKTADLFDVAVVELSDASADIMLTV